MFTELSLTTVKTVGKNAFKRLKLIIGSCCSVMSLKFQNKKKKNKVL